MSNRLTQFAFLCIAVCAAAASCSSCDDDEKGCARGDCRPGNCMVDGQCVEVVGRPCRDNADCPSDICMAAAKDDPDAYCSYLCADTTDCPQGFVCSGDPARCARSVSEDTRECVSNTECGKCGRCSDARCDKSFGCPHRPCDPAGECPKCMECSKGECVPQDGCDGDECKKDADCGGCARCVHGVCFNPADCPYPPCTADTECPYGRKCSKTGGNAGTCVVPGADSIGTDCTPENPAPCNGGICFTDEESSYCTVDCAQDSSLCPYGFSCRIVADEIRYCKKTGEPPVLGKDCAKEADCDTEKGETCVFTTDAEGSNIEPKCSLPFPDGLSLGSACTLAGDCETNLCPSDYQYCSLPCERDADCWWGYVCEDLKFVVGEIELDARGCVYRDSFPGRPGDYCPNGASDCRAGTCPSAPDGGPQPVCLVDCAGGKAVCPDGLVCRDDDVFGSGAQACLPDMLAQECFGDSDCTEGKVCSLAKGEGDGGTAGVMCVTPREGGAKPGEACNYISGTPFCENGQCGRDSICVEYCGGDEAAPCREGYVCDYAPVDLENGTTKNVRACVESRGSRKECVTDNDCEGGEVCRAWSYPGGYQTRFGCRSPRPGGAAAGERCGMAAGDPNAYCYNDLCTAEGRCATHCAADTDCAEGLKCGTVQSKILTGETIYYQGCKTVANQGDIGAPCPNGYIDCMYGLFCADIGYDSDGGVTSVCTKYCDADAGGTDCTPPDAGPAVECRDVNGNVLCLPVSDN
ncbi:MAG: hypothetical protein HY897_01720 [Deltaproteobacteria bacterium]|nr:hypothetical protein [Deltaproteobacteria bacterium]